MRTEEWSWSRENNVGEKGSRKGIKKNGGHRNCCLERDMNVSVGEK